MTKQKVLMCVVVLIASLVVCGCMNMSASVVPPISCAEKRVVEGMIKEVKYFPYGAGLNHNQMYHVNFEDGRFVVITKSLNGENGGVLAKSEDIVRYLDGLVGKTNFYGKITTEKIGDTNSWKVISIDA